MNKFLTGILVLGSFSLYSKCLVSLPYSNNTLRAFYTDDTYTTLDKFAEKIGISIVKRKDANILIEKFYKESQKVSLLCGETKIEKEFLTVDGIEFEGETFSSNSCQPQQKGFGTTTAARSALKYISKKYECKENLQNVNIHTDYSVSHYYYNCKIEHRRNNKSYYLRAQRPNCYWNYDEVVTRRICDRPNYSSDKDLMDHSSEAYGLFGFFSSKEKAKKSIINKALKICHELSVDGVELN